VFLSAAAHARVLDDVPFMRRARATTIYEGIDAGEFRPSRRAGASFRRDFRLGAEPFLLAVGALSPEKRYEFLFESLRRFRNAPTLLICGEGPQEIALRARAIESGIDVRFLGRIPQQTLIGAYTAALGLIHVGASETFGLAVLEAMACGRPIIASDGGALPEVVGATGEAGILVPADSHEHVASAVRQLIDHPDSAMALGRRARERARRLFSVEAMEDAYARVVSRNMPSIPLMAGVRSNPLARDESNESV
jgi:glycosyltransferase involved in cell wall biosynthesis